MSAQPRHLAGLLVLPVALGFSLLGGSLLDPASAGASSGVPFTDTSAHGSIGFCNQAGQQITQGSVNTKPFAWRAVSSQAAPTPYNAPGRTATLLVYQPRQGLEPAQWSGEAITAAARYTNPSHPMSAATTRDQSLAEVIRLYPPSWNGLYELRMFLGAPGQEVDSASYAATVIAVTGSTWHVVQGASVACNSGKANSIESILLPSTTPSAASSAPAGDSSTPAATTSSGAATASSGATPAAAGSSSSSSSEVAAANASDDQNSGGSGGHGVLIAVIALVAAALVAIGLFLARQQRRPGLSRSR